MATLRDIAAKVEQWTEERDRRDAVLGEFERSLLKVLNGAPAITSAEVSATDTDGETVRCRFVFLGEGGGSLDPSLAGGGGLEVADDSLPSFRSWRTRPSRADVVESLLPQVLDAVDAELAALLRG